MACGECDLDVDLCDFAMESVDRVRVTVKKDGVAWTGADSVLFRFVAPDTTETDASATNELPDEGVWYYDTTTSTFTQEGDWVLRVKVTDGSVVKWFPGDVRFTVRDRS